VAAPLKKPTDPRGVGSCLDRDARRHASREAPLEGLGVRGDASLLEDTASFGVRQAQVAVAIAYVYADGGVGLGRHSRYSFLEPQARGSSLFALHTTRFTAHAVFLRPSHPICRGRFRDEAQDADSCGEEGTYAVFTH
jgi:hypothetical protein